MPLNTNFNLNPYFDDYNTDKNFHRVVFKPSVPVQARELTQLQSILQNQIERFGENILKQGSIVKGGNFVDLKNFPYVKISDNNTNNQPINIGNYVGASVIGINSGVSAYVLISEPGLETQSPDLNTLYVKYTGTGTNALGEDIKTFIPGEILEFTVGGNLIPELSVSVVTFGVDPNPIGKSHLVSCGDGIIFQKGFFVGFENQIVPVSKYSGFPDDLVVGFVTEESIVNSNEDNSLLDNAAGFNNYSAPGADRLKLTPKLTVYSNVRAAADPKFFAIQEYQNGSVIRRNVTTQFNSIEKFVETRTAEESGNYNVRGMKVSIKNDPINSQELNASVSPGLSYVDGKRVETVGETSLLIDKGTDFGVVEQQNILANYGNYIVVTGTKGSFNFNSMQKINLYNAAQVASTTAGFTAVGTKIGEARIRAYTRNNATTMRLYLFDFRMTSGNSFSSVKSVTVGTEAFANLVLENSVAVLKDSTFKSVIFPVGKTSLKEIVPGDTDYTTRRYVETSASSGGSITLTLSGNESFPQGAGAVLNSDARATIIVTNLSNGTIYPVTSASVDGSGNTLDLGVGPLGGVTAVGVSFGVKISGVLPTGKVLKTLYMRINPTSFLTGPFHLGWPDVYSIEGVWKHTDLVFTEATPGITNVTGNFTLNKNTNEDFYDISYLTPKNISITASDRFLVKAKVFVKTVSGGYSQSFFTVNSYPVDDTTAILPANKIRTEDIPSRMRDVIDFRPVAVNNASFAETAGAASVFTSGNKLNGISFGASNLNMIAPNEAVETTYSYYMGRKDRLVINQNGAFEIMKGSSSDNPYAPPVPNKGMTVAIINVPPFPTLTPAVANRIGKPQYGATAETSMTPRYTMKDIGDIDERIQRIEYYTALNMLEKSAEDINIKDANGLTRFKNGIIVDNFDDMLLCDVGNDDFKASIDRSESSIAPRQRSYNIPLKRTGLTSAVQSKEGVVTLSYTNKTIINQRYASKYRNCVTDFYSYAGSTTLSPEYDGSYDTTYAPDVTVKIDVAGAFADFTKNLNEIVPLRVTDVRTKTGATKSSSSSTTTNNGSTIDVKTETINKTKIKTFTDIAKLSQSNIKNKQQVGDFITDIDFSPYLRQKRVRVSTSGLRPNTRFYVFFDSVNVNAFCRPGKLVAGKVKLNGAFGLPIKSDSNGNLYFNFRIPAEKFYVGDRELLILDVPDLASRDAATSVSSATYRGFNFSVEKTGIEVSTRMPDFNIARSTDVVKSTVTSTTTQIQSTPIRILGNNKADPIAQTFSIDREMSNDTSVFITKVAVAFFKKSTTKGVKIEIRTTDNGYPSTKTLAFGRVYKSASDVSVSANGSALTEFVFDSPVCLSTETEYAIVVMPDGNNPDYLIWCCKTGQTDLQTNTKLVMDANPGTLFTSTNNKAWTPYQDENMKFVVTKAEFTAAAGKVELSNDDMEFLSTTDFSGKFIRDESVYVSSASNGPGTISTVNGSNIVTGVGTTFNSTFAIGKYIAIRNMSTNKYFVAQIAEITSQTSMVLEEDADVTQNSRTYYKTRSGIVDYFTSVSPAMLFLKNSSAVSGDVFQAGDVIIGEESFAVAEVASVMNLPVSFIQPDIYRTNFSKTSTELVMVRQSSAASVSTAPKTLAFGEDNFLTNMPTVIKSRSNEITNNSGVKSLKLNVNLASTGTGSSRSTSPTVDVDISHINAVQYFVNPVNSTVLTSEAFSAGLAEAKLISKKISLAEGMDAEDLKLWLTAYKPTGTSIDVFVKFKANEDFDNWDETPWTKLDLDASKNFVSSSANRSDFKEFEFSLSDVVKGNGEGAYLVGNSFIYKSASGAQYTNFKYLQVKIVMGSSTHSVVPRIKDFRAIALT